MAWRSVVLRTTGEIITAAIYNETNFYNMRYLKGQDGVIALEDSITLPAGKTVDGTDISAHVADASAHHVKTGHHEVYGLVETGLTVNRPAAGIAGRWFISTDTLEISHDDGVAWNRVGVLRGKDVGALDAGDIATGRFPLARMPDGTAGLVLTAQGAGIDPAFTAMPVDASIDVLATNELIASANTEKINNTSSWVKEKEILVKRSGTYRIQFQIRRGFSSGNAFGRIYKNGVAFGTERTTTSNTYVTFTEDLNFSAGDLIQGYTRFSANVADGAYIRNFRIHGTLIVSTTVNLD